MYQSSYKRCFMNLPHSKELNAEDDGKQKRESQSESIEGYSDEISQLIHVRCLRFDHFWEIYQF